jgi:hypothetical protein
MIRPLLLINKKTILSIVAVILISSCEDRVEVETTYDLSKFQKVLLQSADKINLIKSRTQKDQLVGRYGAPTFSEEEAEEIIDPLMEESRQLIQSYGINIMEEFGSNDNPSIVSGALSIYRLEMLVASGASLEQINRELDAQNSYTTNSDLFDCALEAAGITILIELGNRGATYLSKQLAIKAIKKVAARVLGPIGAAWAAYEFGECMGWW